MNRQLLGLTVAFVAAVTSSWAASTQPALKMTAKRAALQGTAPVEAHREQMIGRMIVKLRGPVVTGLARPMSATRVQALSAAVGVGMKSERALAGDESLLELDTPLSLSAATALAARIARDPAVEYAEPDIILRKLQTVPNDTRFSAWQWNLLAPNANYNGEILPINSGNFKNTTAVGGANLPLAWDLTQGSNAVIVAIIDTGIVNHTDLGGMGVGTDVYVPFGRFLAGYDFISGNVGAGTLPANFVANDGDGRDADASDPGDWVTTQEETDYASLCDDGQAGAQNSSWHGSHMAGVAAAATNNNFGVAGVGWLVQILPVRALGKCGGSLSDIAEAVRWAAGGTVSGVTNISNRASVINLSLGGGNTCPATMQAAVDFAISQGAVVVAATGNEGNAALIAPANCDGVIAVTGHTINGDNADYANVGGRTTISAPGGGSPTLLGAGGPTDDSNWLGYYIGSTILFGNMGPTSTSSSGASGPAFGFFTGTSAATPQVAGVAALIKSRLIADPNVTPAFIRAWLTMRDSITAHPAGGACVGAIFSCGKGLLNARRALDAADNRTPAVSTETFVVVQPNTTVSLVGTAAAFPPAAITSTTWTQVGGSPTVTLNGGTTSTASFTAPATGSVLLFQFVAADNAMRNGADRVTVRVNTPPVITANPPAQTATVGQTVSFTVTGSDADGTTPSFAASAIPTGATLSTTGQFSWPTTGASPGSYSLTYVARDVFSASSPATVSITLAAAAPPPAPPGGSPPPSGGGGGGGALPLWQLLLLGALSMAARVRFCNRAA